MGIEHGRPGDDDRVYLRSAQAAKYRKIAESTQAKERMRGDGPPYIKQGRLVLYLRRDIDHWLAERRRRSTSE